MDPRAPLAILAVGTIFYLALRWHFARAAAILERWAEAGGFVLLEKRYCHFFKGPFFLRTTEHQAVYRVTVRDKAGRVSSGWVACGSWWFGLYSDQAQVRWDVEPETADATVKAR